MSKKSTTGLPKDRKSAPAAGDRGGGEYLTQAEQNARMQLLLVRITVVVIVFVLLLLGTALVVNQFITPNQVIATVDGDSVTVAQFRERVRFERYLLSVNLNNQVANLQSFGFTNEQINQFLQQDPAYNEFRFPDRLGQRVVEDMVSDLLIANYAAQMGITVSDEQVQEVIQEQFGFDPEQAALIGLDPTETPVPTETPTPFVSPTPLPTATSTPTPEAEATEEPLEATATSDPFAEVPPTATLSPTEVYEQFVEGVESFRRTIASANISTDQVDGYFQRLALRLAVRDAIAADIQNPLPHANVRHILVATREEALEVLAALENGESFSDLARAVSLDTGSGRNGGELGWGAVAQYVDPFADAIRDAEIGAIVGPVETQFGFHIIQVRAREDRDADEQQLEQFKEQAFNNWLDEYRQQNAASIEVFDIWVNFVPQQ